MCFSSSLVLGFTSLVLGASPTGNPSLNFHPQQLLLQALEWIEHLGPWGVLAFIGLYTIATVALIPGTFLTLGGGAIFGVVMGSVYVFTGATLGAISAFLVGRYLARDWVFHKIAANRRFRAVDQAVGREGFKIVLLTRLSPAFPFILLNYAYGITRVSLKDYALASVGMIPGTVSYVYLGAVVGNLALLGTETTAVANPWVQWGLRLLGLGATVWVTGYVTQMARRALADSIVETEEASHESSHG
ncbi:TVP38/TMEM64 family protein [Synechocystis sp. LKSZ1]|uniref:TVP38/TMEM64 family protein n=1 Tax=Synechocystis sp. LKSZ1 TaxID=3144951 RepID=UPI00336BCCC0